VSCVCVSLCPTPPRPLCVCPSVCKHGHACVRACMWLPCPEQQLTQDTPANNEPPASSLSLPLHDSSYLLQQNHESISLMCLEGQWTCRMRRTHPQSPADTTPESTSRLCFRWVKRVTQNMGGPAEAPPAAAACSRGCPAGHRCPHHCHG
jgi:hypothetical protein